VAVVFVVGGVHIGSHVAEISNLWRTRADSGNLGRARVVRAGPGMSGVLFAYSRSNWSGWPAGEMKDATARAAAVKGVIVQDWRLLHRIHLFMAALASDRRVL